MITIPKKYVHRKTKRLKWEFVWGEDGKLRDWVFDHNLAGRSIHDLVDYIFPHFVVPSFSANIADDKKATKELQEWMCSHIGSPWTLWSPRTSEQPIPNSKFNTYYFQSETDAVFFKMRWG